MGCLRDSLTRLGVSQVDLYQVHGKVHFLTSIETVAKGLAECVRLGLNKAVGVSNYSKDDMIRMYDGMLLILRLTQYVLSEGLDSAGQGRYTA